MSDAIKQYTVQYNRSSNYRSVHADGFFGGPTGPGMLSISIYSEYSSLPDITTVSVNTLESTQKENIPEENSVERLVDSTVIISPTLAVSLQLWLGDRIEFLRAIGALSEEAIRQVTENHEASRAKP